MEIYDKNSLDRIKNRLNFRDSTRNDMRNYPNEAWKEKNVKKKKQRSLMSNTVKWLFTHVIGVTKEEK